MSKFIFDFASIKTAVRTAGALMLGNVFVGVLMFERTNWASLVWLLLLAIGAIIITSVERRSS